MKRLFTEGQYEVYGRREGATYTVEVRDTDGTPIAWKWFRAEDKAADEHVSWKFRDMIRKAIAVA